MITAFRRGHIVGSEQALLYQTVSVTLDHVQRLALNTFHALQAGGYAHIEPQPEFIEGFTTGFVLCHQYGKSDM